VDSERQLWRSVDALMGCDLVPPSDAVNAADFLRYFDAKVAGVRASTDIDITTKRTTL